MLLENFQVTSSWNVYQSIGLIKIFIIPWKHFQIIMSLKSLEIKMETKFFWRSWRDGRRLSYGRGFIVFWGSCNQQDFTTIGGEYVWVVEVELKWVEIIISLSQRTDIKRIWSKVYSDHVLSWFINIYYHAYLKKYHLKKVF